MCLPLGRNSSFLWTESLEEDRALLPSRGARRTWQRVPHTNLPHSQCNWLFLFYCILFIAKQLPYLPLGEMLRQDGLRIIVIFLCIHYFWSTHHMPGTGTLMFRTRTPRSLLCPVQIRSLEEQCTSQDFTGGRGLQCEWDIDKLEPVQGNRGWSISGPLSNHEVQNLKASR